MQLSVVFSCVCQKKAVPLRHETKKPYFVRGGHDALPRLWCAECAEYCVVTLCRRCHGA